MKLQAFDRVSEPSPHPAAQPTPTDHATLIQSLIANASTEITPASAQKVESFAEHLPLGTAVYITFLPGSDYMDTVALAKRLRDEGMEPVPHFAARSIVDQKQFEDYLARVTGEAGANRVLAIAGALEKPCGAYEDSIKLLETGLFDKYGIKRIGVAGHPEDCPDCSAHIVNDALMWKNDYAQRSDAEFYLVTQFCFEAGPFISWEQRIRGHGVTLPIHAGIPGIASIKTLLNYAMAYGVGNSVNFIKKQARNATKLLKPAAPDRLISELADYMATTPGNNFAGLHFFPLGGLKKTAVWTGAIQQGAFSVDRTAAKITVHA